MNLLQILENMMRDHNILAKSYQMMGEEIEIQRQKAMENNETMPEVQLLFTLKPGMDRNRYNLQRTNEVAAVFSTSADGDIPELYIVIRNINTKTLQYVSSMDPNVEPMIYPLFYPHGNQGWHCNLKRVNIDKRVSRGDYVKYRTAIRDSEFNLYLLYDRLFQQWLVDFYVKIERDRLEYCKANQKKLRIDSYQGLIDYMQNSANQNNTNVGKMVILPSTFIGSPRNMMQHYQDLMAIVRKHGKPDIFLTMTCNPNWRKIRENLCESQTAVDRPDLVARVFSLKVKYLMDLIVRQRFFGEVLSFVYVIEFEKRGLPHIHLLIILKPNCKIKTSEKVDRYISSEIPDPKLNPDLHEIVMKNMIHGPCGDWCVVNEKCSKNYPKEFCETTTINENEGVRYCRRNKGITYNRTSNYVVDNRYVVPYCPILLLLLRAYINVEIVIDGQKSAKYLYKYIYKGHNASAIEIGEINHDEIKDFVETRYVGPVEAVRRILNKNLQEKSHSICRLPVHLPNEQNIAIDDKMTGNEIESVLNQVTMLLDYFALNTRDPNARNYYYTDIPLHYTFKKEKIDGKTVSQWKPREKFDRKSERILNEFLRKFGRIPDEFHTSFVRIIFTWAV
ncbi:uncharacterized protein LOC127283125 [Leptopilina boulardi]|uniref:uncharacterized protein LOC127283125 n=1 Tax=Leptopilina boulardi TaxID=63433 RepID=UPI0021F53CEC|nr:uncharacterized protein LOC127283125 [Leptopilina boulardi]